MITEHGLITSTPLHIFHPEDDIGIIAGYWTDPGLEQSDGDLYIPFLFNWPSGQNRLSLDQEQQLRDAVRHNIQDCGFGSRSRPRTLAVSW